MAKTLEQNFTDWEGSTFGFGYGTGEPHIIPALRQFMELCPHQYDYTVLEAALTPTVAWLLINVLCKVDMLKYGTSPRFAWLTHKGHALRKFMLSKSADELVELVCSRTEDDSPCYPDVCNCGPDGYQAGVKCDNPFWNSHEGSGR